eukprot:GHVO01034364.1.p1 GENE.GHVO01034364.1~~GHVO01034364.1.p1  ORF type:complete len:488 (+),score=34.21 GHVO01034364.1:120-1583(+)
MFKISLVFSFALAAKNGYEDNQIWATSNFDVLGHEGNGHTSIVFRGGKYYAAYLDYNRYVRLIETNMNGQLVDAPFHAVRDIPENDVSIGVDDTGTVYLGASYNDTANTRKGFSKCPIWQLLENEILFQSMGGEDEYCIPGIYHHNIRFFNDLKGNVYVSYTHATGMGVNTYDKEMGHWRSVGPSWIIVHGEGVEGTAMFDHLGHLHVAAIVPNKEANKTSLVYFTSSDGGHTFVQVDGVETDKPEIVEEMSYDVKGVRILSGDKTRILFWDNAGASRIAEYDNGWYSIPFTSRGRNYIVLNNNGLTTLLHSGCKITRFVNPSYPVDTYSVPGCTAIIGGAYEDSGKLGLLAINGDALIIVQRTYSDDIVSFDSSKYLEGYEESSTSTAAPQAAESSNKILTIVASVCGAVFFSALLAICRRRKPKRNPPPSTQKSAAPARSGSDAIVTPPVQSASRKYSTAGTLHSQQTYGSSPSRASVLVAKSAK